MHIEIDTEALSEAAARTLITLIRVTHPDLLNSAAPDVLVAAAAHIAAGYSDSTHAQDVADAAADNGYDAGPTDPVAAFAQPAPLDPVAAFAGGAPLAGAEAPAGALTPPSAGAPPGVELDPDGLPWDARIHAATKGRNKDQRWKGKKGVSDETKAQVIAELRAVLGAPAATPQPAAAPDTTASGAGPATSAPAAPAGDGAGTGAAIAASPSDAPPPPPPPTPTPQQVAQQAALAEAGGAPSPTMLFAGAMKKVTDAQSAGQLTVVDVGAICTSLGLTSPRDLMVRPDLVPQFEAQVAAYVASAPPA